MISQHICLTRRVLTASPPVNSFMLHKHRKYSYLCTRVHKHVRPFLNLHQGEFIQQQEGSNDSIDGILSVRNTVHTSSL